jgi:tetratricopeptide (TPR) repeat protein
VKVFSTNEVANILSLPNSRIRSFVRAGFIAPERNRRKALQFNFHDLLFLKTAKSLLDSHIPAKTIIRMLSSLKRSLPDEASLTRLKIYADGRRIVVWDGKARYQPDSGQFLFDFDPRAVLRTVKLSSRKTANDDRAAGDWFTQGCELEEKSPEKSMDAYTKALEMDPTLSEAHINLGRLCHNAGMLKQSEEHYRAALAIKPDDPTPYFNLGVLLEDSKRPADAARAYAAAIERDPTLADAHYNLGLLLDAFGKKKDAFSHLRTARNLYLGK